MFRIPVIPKTYKTTLIVSNIVLDPSLKRFYMHDLCNLRNVGKLECVSHKPSCLVLFACDSIWFTWFFVDTYLVAFCCLVSVAPNILWLITFANFRNIETFHMERQWWHQKFSTAIIVCYHLCRPQRAFYRPRFWSLFLKSVLTSVPIVNFYQ